MDTDRFASRTLAARTMRARRPEPGAVDRSADAESTGRYRQACRDAETARLLLAELGRWHGPMA